MNGLPDGFGIRVGCDVTSIDEVRESLAAFGSRYLDRVFTGREVRDCGDVDPVPGLAARFAAKEAVIKAFASPDESYPLQEIEVMRDGPLPTLRLSGSLADLARTQGWVSTAVSLSHGECHASAVVMVVCGGPVPPDEPGVVWKECR